MLEQLFQPGKDIESRYDRICEIGEKSESPPVKTAGEKGRYERTKGRSLAERLIRERDAVLAFAFNKEAPFTNNLAERDIRPAWSCSSMQQNSPEIPLFTTSLYHMPAIRSKTITGPTTARGMSLITAKRMVLSDTGIHIRDMPVTAAGPEDNPGEFMGM